MVDKPNPEKGGDVGDPHEPTIRYPICFLSQPAFPPQAFFKWAMGIMAVAMVTFSATLIAMAITLNSYATAVRDAEARLTAKIQHHTEVSLENRSVQNEVKGLLSAYLKLFEDHQRKFQQQP